MSLKAIKAIIKTRPQSREELMRIKRRTAKKYGEAIKQNSEILKVYNDLVRKGNISRDLGLEGVLRKRSIRTLSGIAPVAVLTKNYPCPGKCAYCPTETDVPKSYLSNEPAVMRAIRNNYDPYKQTQLRLKALENNGHLPTKIELIVIGGTWSILPRKYKYWYIKECFRAANDYPKDKDQKDRQQKKYSSLSLTSLRQELARQQKKNEKAIYRLIGITLETRPDYIDEKEVVEMRELGATRVEIGVQAIDDRILAVNKRGHGVDATIQATQKLRDYGFKVTYHIMPGLPGSTYKKDLKMFKELFHRPEFQPDQIKFYPTVVTKGSLLYRWWKQGKYRPYSDKQLQNLIIDCKKVIPPYTRVIRLIRDIPGESIEAGNKITNLRQVMKDRGVKCECIRCREAKEKKIKKKDLVLKTLDYKASGGEERFISFESRDGSTLYGFLRLRLPGKDFENALIKAKNTALIRELHVYGELVSVGEQKKKVQHSGLGKDLMAEAERQAKEEGYKNIAVISGVGVRGYYRKRGYWLKNTYMIKKFKS